jgi:hypothetical protein
MELMPPTTSNLFGGNQLQTFDASWILLSLLVVAAIIGVLGLTIHYWKRKNQNTDAPPFCGFSPQRIFLRGYPGDVLRVKVQTEGPPGTVFTTYVEEPWLVAVPSSGMIPQEVEVIAYTNHAPPHRKHSILLRMFPIDSNLPSESLQVEVRLKEPRPNEGLSPR